MPPTQTLATPALGNKFPRSLAEISARLKREARARPDTMVQPPQPLGNKAILAMVYYCESKTYVLRIARKGLSPHNDFSDAGTTRLKRWQNEIKTFRRDLPVPAAAEMYDGAAEMFYWVDLYWKEDE